MKLNQFKKANVQKIDNKLFLELPKGIVKSLNISDSDTFIVTLKQGAMILRKSSELDIPEALYNELTALFNGNEDVIAQWLYTPKAFLENKAPIDMLETSQGLESVLDMICRIKTGDVS